MTSTIIVLLDYNFKEHDKIITDKYNVNLITLDIQSNRKLVSVSVIYERKTTKKNQVIKR
jgi:hypothetical protein